MDGVFTDLQEELKCGLCHDYSELAVETTCCKKMFCQSCLTEYSQSDDSERKCPNPLCTVSYIAYRVSDLARRMVARIPFICPDCGASVARNERNSHLMKCPRRVFDCQSTECEFTGEASDYMNHLTERHSEHLLEHSRRLFSEPEGKILSICPFPSCGVTDTKAQVTLHMVHQHKLPVVKVEKGARKCPICEQFDGSRDDMMNHIVEKHFDELKETAPERFSCDHDNSKHDEAFSIGCQTRTPMIENQTANGEVPLMANDNGDSVRIGSNGKVYCGGNFIIGADDLHEVCQPRMNCPSCVRFECNIRDLHEGELVNSAGLVTVRRFLPIGSIGERAKLCRPLYSCNTTTSCTYRRPCFPCRLLCRNMSEIHEVESSVTDLLPPDGMEDVPSPENAFHLELGPHSDKNEQANQPGWLSLSPINSHHSPGNVIDQNDNYMQMSGGSKNSSNHDKMELEVNYVTPEVHKPKKKNHDEKELVAHYVTTEVHKPKKKYAEVPKPEFHRSTAPHRYFEADLAWNAGSDAKRTNVKRKHNTKNRRPKASRDIDEWAMSNDRWMQPYQRRNDSGRKQAYRGKHSR